MRTWTTAYAAALADPADTLPFMPQPQSFRGQTVRQVVRLRRGSARLRLALSNEFGHAPLVIDEVTVAAARGGPTTTAVLGGRVRWEIPPGETAASDPVPLPAAAGDEVAVSCVMSPARPSRARTCTPPSAPATSRLAARPAGTSLTALTARSPFLRSTGSRGS